MKVGILTTSYPRFEGDVAGVFVRGMARALAARGHRIDVLAPAPRAAAGALDDPGVRVHHVAYAPGPLRRTFYGAGVPDNVRRDPRAWPGLGTFPWALRRATGARVDGWDALISHWALPSALVAGAIRDTRPHLAVLHSADVHLMRRLPFRGAWARAVADASTHLLCASGALRRELLSWIPPVPRARVAGRCHASAMGIEPPAPVGDRAALRRRLGLSRFTALSLGRLVPIKGLDRAIDALAGLDVELVIAGDGPERRRLEDHAARRRAPVRFLGVRTGRAKAELFAAADAFVLPSLELASGRTEGTPTTALEAAAAGLPIVASATGGLAEVFAEGRSALLVPPGDARALRAALARLVGNAPLRRRLASGARRLGHAFTWEALAPRIEALLEDR